MATMFDNLKKPIDFTKHNLMYGVTDWGRLNQFNLYESGYSFLYVVDTPVFLQVLGKKNQVYQDLLNNFVHILQFEFKGLDGLDDITSETLEINDGISQMNVISKVVQQSAGSISMRFNEKSGSVLTKLQELYLTGIKDPRTQVKRYHGCITPDGTGLEAGYENEVFTLLYMVTDNTALQLEKAFLLLNCQPTKAPLSIYESEKGDIGTKEVSIEMNCFPVTGAPIYEAATKILGWMNSDLSGTYKFVWDSTTFDYTGTQNIVSRIDNIQKSGGLTTV